MVNKVLLPSEIETYYVLPALRRHFAEQMKEQGMKQKDIALILGVKSAAISQYRSKRGRKLEFDPALVEDIKRSTPKIKDHFSYVQETQRLLRQIRTTNVLCRIHKQFSPVPLGCSLETMGCHL